ncbi:MAG: hypothetical protein NTV63_05170 [Candidatus Woesearchaeota archaeon]|nr:hypothetical protein [Candidatus Woesearchaeota archaeon]
MKTSKKRGGSEIDVIISLTLFMLFVAWFFVFLKPISEPKNSASSLYWIIERNLKSMNWQVEKTMVVLKSNLSSNEPAIIPLPYPWLDNNTVISPDAQFAIEDGRIFTYADFSNADRGKIFFYLIHSSHNSSSLPSPGINAMEGFSTTEHFRADFTNSILRNMSYNNISVLYNFSVSANNVMIIPESSSFTNRKIIAIYRFSSGEINHSYYVFHNSSMLFGFLNSENPAMISMNFSLYNFSNYYIDNEKSGNITEEGASHTAQFIELYSPQIPERSIAFAFNTSVEIRIRETGEFAELEIEKELESIEYRIIPHSGDYTAVINYSRPYEVAFGILANLSGISEEKASAENRYSIVSSGYPSGRGLFVQISCSGKNMEIGNAPVSDSDIYSKEIDDFILYPNGTRESCNVGVSAW